MFPMIFDSPYQTIITNFYFVLSVLLHLFALGPETDTAASFPESCVEGRNASCQEEAQISNAGKERRQTKSGHADDHGQC